MPINYKRDYNPGFKALALQLKIEAGWVCQLCGAKHGHAHPITGSRVVLTTMHLDQNKKNDSPENLRVACYRCHIRYDVKYRVYNRNTAIRKAGQTYLPFAA